MTTSMVAAVPAAYTLFAAEGTVGAPPVRSDRKPPVLACMLANTAHQNCSCT